MITLAKPSTLIVGSDTARSLALANEKTRKFSEHIQQQVENLAAPVRAALGVLKTTPLLFLHAFIRARKSASNWLLVLLQRLDRKRLKLANSKVKTVTWLGRKLTSLTYAFPTSSSVNP